MSTPPGTVAGYVYVIYVRARSGQVWEALTSADLTARFWGHANVSDWQRGSRWESNLKTLLETGDVLPQELRLM